MNVLSNGSALYALNGFIFSTNSFFFDPYSSYSSYIADSTFAGTNGTSTTVSWGGGSLTAPTYSTIQAAVTAVAGPNKRICLLAGQVWNVSSAPIQAPSYTGASDLARFVIQGDPAATADTMPILTGNGAGTFGIAIGAADGANPQTNSYMTVRKLKITNFIGSAGVAGIVLDDRSGATFDYAVIEFCDINTFQASGSAGESGSVYIPSVGSTSHLEVRYCKLSNVTLVGGTGINENHSCIGLYGGQVTIHHNEMSQAYNGVRFKGCNALVPIGCSVYKNYIHDTNVGISSATGGAWPSINGVPIYNNLFGWESLNNTLWQSGSAAWNDFGSNTSSTTVPTNVSFYNNTITQGWAGGLLNVASTNFVSHDNIILCTTPIQTSENTDGGTVSLCDYNFYFTGNWNMNVYGTPAPSFSVFAGATGWQTAHTQYPTLLDLNKDPDPNGEYIPNLVGYTTIAANFPNYSTYDYTLATSSPIRGKGTQGIDPGYNSQDCGPGW